MARPNSFEYSELLPSEKVEGDERRSIETLREELHPRLKSTRRRAHTTIWASLAVGAFALCCLSMFFLGLRWQLNADRMCMERQSIYSPMWEDVYPSYTPVRFNGTLDAPSEFRGPPSPEVDRAWMRLKDVGSLRLDEDQFFRAGGNAENARMPDEFGGGYMADVEVLHQMHCLNFVRMAAYEDYYRDKAKEWTDSDHTFHIHLDHCIEMIRINLLCQADAGIIPFKWLDGYNRPFPDFSTPHKCRNYNAILDWATERQAPVPEGHVWTVQPGEKIFPRPAWMLSA